MLQNIREEKEHIAGAKHHMNDSSTFPVVMWPLRYNGIKACLIPGNKLYPETAMVKNFVRSCFQNFGFLEEISTVKKNPLPSVLEQS